MTTRITIEFDVTPEGIAEAHSALLALGGPNFPAYEGEQTGEQTSAEANKPKRGRKAKDAAPAAQPAAPAAAAPAAPADPLAMLGLGASAGSLPPTAPAAAPVAAPAPVAASAPAPAATAPQAAQPSQQDLIKAFVTLGQTPPPKGGADAIKSILGALGAGTVTAIKPEQYAQAIEAVRTKLA